MENKELAIMDIKKGEVCVLKICWKLDVNTSPLLEAKFSALLESGEKDFILDFSEVVYISSSGLRAVLMGAKKSAAAGGKTVLCALKPQIIEVFNVAGFTPLFSLFATEEDALESFK